MIKIDSDPIKIDDVIGSISEMDGAVNNLFVTVERFVISAKTIYSHIALDSICHHCHRVQLFVDLFNLNNTITANNGQRLRAICIFYVTGLRSVGLLID